MCVEMRYFVCVKILCVKICVCRDVVCRDIVYVLVGDSIMCSGLGRHEVNAS